MSNLVVVVIGQDCQDTIKMCLESVKESDTILYIDGGSRDNTLDIVRNFAIDNNKSNGKVIIKENLFNKANPNAISEQRNFYLNYLKEEFTNDWCLVLDADEVLDTNGIKKLKDFTSKNPVNDIYSIRMRHLMYTLGFEDTSQSCHFVPNRLFKITKDLFYPTGEHCILNGEPGIGKILDPIVWHLGYLGGVWDVKKRYDQQVLRNSGHSKEFLKQWNYNHILGLYPIDKINIDDLPEVILNNFSLSTDEVYFKNRMNLEYKHFLFVKQWNEFFKPKSVADFGCGTGLYLYAWEMTNAKCHGYEYSNFAINNKKCDSTIYQLDLNNKSLDIPIVENGSDLVTALDVLEHLEYDKLDNAIDNLIFESDKYILTSIPYKGTPNCEMDKTHIIKESEDWWRQKFLDKGLKEVEVPEHFIFKEQLLIFEK